MADIRTRASRYSNPRLGAAFESLADVFAPPTGSDLYGYTKAASEKQKMQRMGDLWNMRDSLSQDQYDRAVGIVNGSPISTGYYGVNTKATTDRRGQDIDLQGKVYDVNSRDATSRANNTADNVRATRVGFGTVSKDATQYIDEETAKILGVAPGVRTGVIATAPGEISHVPQTGGGYSQVKGADKPLTETEMNAIIMRDLLTKPEQKAKVMGSTPVAETPQGPMYNPDRVAAGVPEIDKTQPQAFNSKRGALIWDPVKRSYVPAPGVEGPLQSPSAAQGKDGALGPTTANSTTATNKEAQLNELDLAIEDYDKHLANNPGAIGVPGAVRGAMQNAVSVLQEFKAAFGDTPLDAVVTPVQMQQVATRVGVGDRDPAIAQARVKQLNLAYKLAQLQNPSGEVSRQALERNLDVVTGGSLPNNQSAREALVAMREMSKQARVGVGSLRNPGGAGAPAPAAPAGPRVLQTPAGNVTIEPVQ